MKSPFPGTDPYIEARGLWGDFHHDLISGIKHALALAAPERYVVRTGDRSYRVLVESKGDTEHPSVPEAVLEIEPTRMRAFIVEEHREAFVEVYETDPEQRLVTTIEVLSPSNKRPKSEGWEQYLRKRQSLLLGNVNLVEIDLLRGGQRMPMLDPWPECPYTLLVARAHNNQRCKVWPAHFQLPLPTIPVPLAKPDPDISLDLQPMIEMIYEISRYEQTIDYSKPLTPPLSSQETTWLKQQLRVRDQ